jgi:two-component system chemotaxis response regulator CheY
MEKDAQILLVDDSMAIRQTVKSALLNLGYSNIHLATTGTEALAKIRAAIKTNQMYQMIFLDWNMPEMDGLTLLKVCRDELPLKQVGIIMLTALSDQKSIVTALSNGANSYITKPVSVDTISKKIDQVSAWLANQAKTA